MRKIAIIPARGGSKRIPRKNIKPFFGKPVIAYAIELALESKLFERVIVSTDDDEIAEISKLYGAEVPFIRSKENSTDNASTFDVLKEVINWFSESDEVYELACCIYPITPLLNGKNLEKGLKKLIEGKFDSILPLVKYEHPIQRSFYLNSEECLEFSDIECFKKNTQDLKPHYHDTGQFYWFNIGQCLKKNGLITNNSSFIELSYFDYQDVDCIEDWKKVEYKFKYRNNGKIN